MLPLLSSLTQTWPGCAVLLISAVGLLCVACAFVGLLWIGVAEWNVRMRRRRMHRLDRASARTVLLNPHAWKQAKDVEDSVLYRDFKSEEELARERIAVPGEVI